MPSRLRFAVCSCALSPDGDEDQTISPYASYTSLGHGAAPIISGWLDKLSPQGCVCFMQLLTQGQRKHRAGPGAALRTFFQTFKTSLCVCVWLRFESWSHALVARVVLVVLSCVSSSSFFSSSFLTGCVCVFLLFSRSATLVRLTHDPEFALDFRNYVFQKRFVKFDGKNLLYFGNEKVSLESRLDSVTIFTVVRFPLAGRVPERSCAIGRHPRGPPLQRQQI